MEGAVMGESLVDEVAMLADEVGSLEEALVESTMQITDLERRLESARADIRTAGFLGLLIGAVATLLYVAVVL